VTILPQQIAQLHRVQVVQAGFIRTILLGEAIDVRPKIEHRQVPPRVPCQVLDLFPVEPQFGQNFAVVKILISTELPAEVPTHTLAARIVEIGEIEFFDVAPIEVIARFGKLLRAQIRIKAVGERFMQGADVSSGSRGCFNDGYIVPSRHEFIRAGKAGDSGTGDNDFLGPPRLRPIKASCVPFGCAE
jgi:hypothetical protein